jgi:dynein regulatry complex protein 1
LLKWFHIQKRYEALQIEAVSSGRKNAAVEMKWADLLYVDIPQELHDQLLLQKEACANILDSKDRRIREFLTELKTKDEEYQKMLKRQSADANNNIKKMRKQYVVREKSY